MPSIINADNGVASGSVGLKYSSDNSGVLALQTNDVERMRITSGGYTKMSNSGNYGNVSGSYHELYNDANAEAVVIRNANASFNQEAVVINVDRNTTNNSYYFLRGNVPGVGTRFLVADSGAIGTAGGISLGNVTPPTSGIGIQFPATQSASSNANTLDDYEEGTWTPEFLALSGSVTVTYGNRYGRYTKIGNLVYADFLVAWSARSGGSGLLALSMPFAPFAGGEAHNGSGVVAYAAGLPVNALLYGDSGSTRAVFIKSGTANSYFSPSELGSGGGQIMGSFTFQTS